MLTLPSTTTTRFSQHVRGDEYELALTVPALVDQYPVINLFAWSFSEKPWPIGKFELWGGPPGQADLMLWSFDITRSGFQQHNMGDHQPYTPMNTELVFKLIGNASRKELAVQLQ